MISGLWDFRLLLLSSLHIPELSEIFHL